MRKWKKNASNTFIYLYFLNIHLHIFLAFKLTLAAAMELGPTFCDGNSVNEKNLMKHQTQTSFPLMLELLHTCAVSHCQRYHFGKSLDELNDLCFLHGGNAADDHRSAQAGDLEEQATARLCQRVNLNKLIYLNRVC